MNTIDSVYPDNLDLNAEDVNPLKSSPKQPLKHFCRSKPYTTNQTTPYTTNQTTPYTTNQTTPYTTNQPSRLTMVTILRWRYYFGNGHSPAAITPGQESFGQDNSVQRMLSIILKNYWVLHLMSHQVFPTLSWRMPWIP